MNNREADEIMGLLVRAFPQSKMGEDGEAMWLIDLASLTHSEAAAAVRACRDSLDWLPSWHQFLEAVRGVRRERARDADRVLPPPRTPSERQAAINRAGSALVRARMKRCADKSLHYHHVRVVAVLDENGDPMFDEHDLPLTRRTERGELCVVCNAHDHDNVTVFGHSMLTQHYQGGREFSHREPIFGWYFDCPKCGDPQLAQLLCHDWTPEGIAFMRAGNHSTIGMRLGAPIDAEQQEAF